MVEGYPPLQFHVALKESSLELLVSSPLHCLLGNSTLSRHLLFGLQFYPNHLLYLFLFLPDDDSGDLQLLRDLHHPHIISSILGLGNCEPPQEVIDASLDPGH